MTHSPIIPAVILLGALLISCGAEPVSDPAASDTTESAALPAETEQINDYTRYDPQLPAIDGGGADIHILTRELDGTYCQQLDNISADGETGDTLNDAIFRRNSAVMEKYNVNFDIIVTGDISGKVKRSVAADDNAYDFFFEGISANVVLSSQGYLLPLDDLDAVDLEKPYWCQKIMKNLSFGGNHYLGVSDLTEQAYFSAGVIYFNKVLANEYDLESPYDFVRNGTWTIDRMLSLCKSVSSDLDGDGSYTEKDQYGLTYNNFAWQIMFYGSGLNIIENGPDGLYFNGTDERIVNTLQKLMPISGDNTVCLYSENYGHLGGNYRINVCQNAFYEGRALFWLEAMYGVPTLRSMELDFGLLPVPKYSEEQEDYSSFIHTTHGTAIAVPATLKNTALVGSVIEDLTYLSSGETRDAFIERTIKGKLSRDSESAESVDIIISNICTDYALLLNNYGLAVDTDMRKLMDLASTDILSAMEAKRESYETVLAKFNDTFGTEG